MGSNENHGCYPASDYTGCPVINVPFTAEALLSGHCPDCGPEAKVYPIKPKVIVLLDSQPLISGTRYSLDKVRCYICEKYFIATLADDLKDRPKYNNRSITGLIINHYYAGLPFHRIEMLQKAQQIPLPDSTQFDLISAEYNRTFKAVYPVLEKCAAQGENIFFGL